MIATSGKGATANDACYSVAEERRGLDDSFRVPLSINIYVCAIRLRQRDPSYPLTNIN